MEKTWELVTSWERVRQIPAELDQYIDLVLSNDDKPRIACDKETYNLFTKGEVPVPWPTDKGREARVRLFQLGLNPEYIDKQYLIDVKALVKDDLNPWQVYYELGNLFRPIFSRANIIGQNFKYDWGFLYTYFGIDAEDITDTFNVAKVVTAGNELDTGYNLGSLCKIFIKPALFEEIAGMTYEEYFAYKHEMQKFDWELPLTERHYEYGALDVKLLFILLDSIWSALETFIEAYENDFKPYEGTLAVIKLANAQVPIASLMELKGVGFDLAYQKNVVNKYLDDKAEQAEKELRVYPEFYKIERKSKGRLKNKEIWEERTFININSSKQLPPALLDLGIKLPIDPKSKTKGPSCKMEYLEEVANQPNAHPCMKWVMQYRRCKSLKGKYGDGLAEKVAGDGRIHCSWKPCGTNTGRWSCSGPNLQQQKGAELLFEEIDAAKLFRPMFAAADGYELIAKDYSQIQLMLIAQKTRDPAMVEEYNKPKPDLHTRTGRLIYKKDLLTKAERQVGKTLNFTVFFKASPRRVVDTIKQDTGEEWTEEQAEEIIGLILDGYPKVKEAMKKSDQAVWALPNKYKNLAKFGKKPFFISRTSYLKRHRLYGLNPYQQKEAKETPSLYHLGNPGRNPARKAVMEACREAYNSPIQGDEADIMQMAIVNIYRRLKEEGLIPKLDGSQMVPIPPPDNFLIIQCHDELVAECREEYVEQFDRIMQEEMKAAGDLVLTKVKCIVEGGPGKNWYEAK